MRTAAILPVKSFARAKQRLGASVDDALRLELAAAMVADVLLALSQTPAIELTIVVTREQAVAERARAQGAIVVEDQTESGQSAAVSLGVARALREGIERVLCIPGDCPALDPAELDSLLSSSPDPGSGSGSGRGEVVIVPDRHGSGTNGLLLSPPDAIPPSFGPDSCARHRALAREASLACRLEAPSSLTLDIDTGADLAALRGRLTEARSRARETRAALGQATDSEILTPCSG